MAPSTRVLSYWCIDGIAILAGVIVGSETLLLGINDSSTTPMHCTALKVGSFLGAILQPTGHARLTVDKFCAEIVRETR